MSKKLGVERSMVLSPDLLRNLQICKHRPQTVKDGLTFFRKPPIISL
jgi:hypothetical protein